MRYLAPTGTPIDRGHLAKCISQYRNETNVLESFADKIKRTYNVKHCLFLSSGRTALYILLEELARLANNSSRTEVIIPSYTCYSVPGSVFKAGLSVRVCDVDLNSLNYDLEKLSNYDFSKVLAIVTSNLYGIPNNLPEIKKIADKNGVYLVDDAAQCLGAEVGGKYSGTWGDAGIFSFDKGKNITSIQGGVIVTNSETIADAIEKRIDTMPPDGFINVLLTCIKLLVYSILLPPKRYWMITKIPFTGLGSTPYTTDYPVHQYSALLGSMASILFDDLSTFTQARVSNAKKLFEGLNSHNGVEMVDILDSATPVYLRFPIRVTDPELRRELIDSLEETGIGATTSYPTAISELEAIKADLHPDDLHMPNGSRIAHEIVTLPTQPYTSQTDIDAIISAVDKIICK